MKNPLIILVVLAVLAVGGWFVFTQTSMVPEDVQRADIESVDNTNGTDSTGAVATTTIQVNGEAVPGSVLAELDQKYAIQDFNFSFVGYGPAGKTETGTFKSITLSEIGVDASGNPISAKIVIDPKSVSTGIERLDTHLCADDFFNCAVNPNIVFDLKKVSFAQGTSDVTVMGALTLNGITNDVTFKVTQNKFTVAADFLLDTTPFKLKYAGVNKEVRIKFGFNVIEK